MLGIFSSSLFTASRMTPHHSRPENAQDPQRPAFSLRFWGMGS